MNCIKCKGTMRESVTTHVEDMGRCCIVVRRVPCSVCEACGEVFFFGDVMTTLEKITATIENAMTEVAVISYPGVVA